MKTQRIFVLVAALFVSVPAFSGDSGCGLGSMIISKNTKVSQTLAVTTNSSFLTQLFGITSGTSGCSASEWVMNNKEAVQYAETNFQNLKVDMARGSGESLAALSQIAGCSGLSSESVGQVTRDSFSEIVTSEEITAVEMLQNWGRVLRSSPQTARTCGLSV